MVLWALIGQPDAGEMSGWDHADESRIIVNAHKMKNELFLPLIIS